MQSVYSPGEVIMHSHTVYSYEILATIGSKALPIEGRLRNVTDAIIVV